MRIDKLTPPEEKIDPGKARFIRVMRGWAVFMLISAVLCAIYFPLWALIFLAPLGVITYVFSFIVAALGLNVPREPNYAGLTGVPSINVSKQIGSLNGKPIYEWVELCDEAEQRKRFVYYGPTPDDGVPQDDQFYVEVAGVLYVEQPV
jgi:hypothetical protein